MAYWLDYISIGGDNYQIKKEKKSFIINEGAGALKTI